MLCSSEVAASNTVLDLWHAVRRKARKVEMIEVVKLVVEKKVPVVAKIIR